MAVMAPLALAGAPGEAPAAGKVLRVSVDADLKNIDPIRTTAYITHKHGAMPIRQLSGGRDKCTHT